MYDLIFAQTLGSTVQKTNYCVIQNSCRRYKHNNVIHLAGAKSSIDPNNGMKCSKAVVTKILKNIYCIFSDFLGNKV